MSESFDEAEVRRALAILVEEGAVFEIRAVEARLAGSYRPGIISGYFDSIDACIAELKKLVSAEGVYVTMNPVDPALLARRHNRLDNVGKESTTGDQHILQLLCFLIDVDYDRPKGISTTNEEKELTRLKTREIYCYLKKRGLPLPVAGDSGNGHHLIYRIKVACEDKGLLEKALKALADRFDEGKVKIDLTVFNPSRIIKLYGTWARKGDNTPDRPHRLSKILDVPKSLEVVSTEQLQALVDELQPEQPAPPKVSAAHGTFDVEAFFQKHAIAYKEKRILSDGREMWLLEACPFNPDHNGTEVAVFRWPSGKLGFQCKHSSDTGKGWKDFRRLFEPESSRKTSTAKSESEPADSVEVTSLTSFDLTPYPAPLSQAAFHGLAGQFVKRVLPYTESDEAALLFQFHTCFGNVIGRTAHMIADAAPHYCNTNLILVGPTSIARKGTAWRHNLRLFSYVDEDWTRDCIKHGVSSGEGIIFHVRDPIEKTVPVKEKGKFTGRYETVTEDPGVKDKRLMIVETEFASVLKVMERSGNTVSVVFRHMWDGDSVLSTLTKNSPVRATGAHGSVLGHITVEELRRLLTETEMANGFGNRFKWIAVKRRQELPENDELPAIADLVQRLHKSIEFAKTAGQLKRDEEARELWASVYHDLSEGKPGLFGTIIARAAPQVLRQSLHYALLDCSPLVRVEHLQAALECWRYCEESARWIFQAGTGNRNADRILAALAAAGKKGLTKSEITANVFNRNATKLDIDEALRLLHRLGLAFCKMEDTATRPAERWFYNFKKNEVYEESKPGDGETGDTSYFSSFSAPQNASPAKSDTEAETLVSDESGVARL